MTDLLVDASLYLCWGTVVFVWIAGALYNARRAPRERVRDRSGAAAYVVAIAICAVVVSAGYEFLHSLVIDAAWARVLGFAILVASTVFTLWARFALGTMWSVSPEVGGDRCPARGARAPGYG
jgi:protein-S-isoprenylcysteine O-methyltransferase Ste14